MGCSCVKILKSRKERNYEATNDSDDHSHSKQLANYDAIPFQRFATRTREGNASGITFKNVEDMDDNDHDHEEDDMYIYYGNGTTWQSSNVGGQSPAVGKQRDVILGGKDVRSSAEDKNPRTGETVQSGKEESEQLGECYSPVRGYYTAVSDGNGLTSPTCGRTSPTCGRASPIRGRTSPTCGRSSPVSFGGGGGSPCSGGGGGCSD